MTSYRPLKHADNVRIEAQRETQPEPCRAILDNKKKQNKTGRSEKLQLENFELSTFL